MIQGKYSQLFIILDKTLQNFIQEVNNQKLQNLATQHWTVKDVLCHIVFWHTYYAQNYLSLSEGKTPTVFTSKGGSLRNQEGVNSLKTLSKDDLFAMLQIAQQTLYNCIVIKHVPEMNYTDRKKYKTEDFLEEINRHIIGHTKQVKKAKLQLKITI